MISQVRNQLKIGNLPDEQIVPKFWLSSDIDHGPLYASQRVKNVATGLTIPGSGNIIEPRGGMRGYIELRGKRRLFSQSIFHSHAFSLL